MKVRKGFVSNSSSSSFILKFEKNKDMKQQIDKMLNKIVDTSELQEDLTYYGIEDINEEDYKNYEEYQQALLKAYKDFIIEDLYDSLQNPINIESIKKDIELSKHINKIDFHNSNLFNNWCLLHYDWNSSQYIFNNFLAKQIINDTDNNYYTLTVSDHYNENNRYDGNLEQWLSYDTEYVVNIEDGH